MKGETNSPECNYNINKPPYGNLKGYVDVHSAYGEDEYDADILCTGL